ncbi:MAG: GTPase domain-containing protein [Bacillota bacterium]
MRDCLIIGLANVGKTQFALALAQYLGLDRVEAVFTYPDGVRVRHHYQLDEAFRELVGTSAHKTRSLITLSLDLHVGKAVKQVRLSDSAGLTDKIHEVPEIRQAMAQTLREVRHADMIIHVFDAERVGLAPSDEGSIALVDRQLANYARLRGGYLMIANKMDLAHAAQGLTRLRQAFPEQLILPVSALQKKGLKEVKAVVARSV